MTGQPLPKPSCWKATGKLVAGKQALGGLWRCEVCVLRGSVGEDPQEWLTELPNTRGCNWGPDKAAALLDIIVVRMVFTSS